MTSARDWAAFTAAHGPGDVVAVTVTRSLPFGALVETTEGVPGLLRDVRDLLVGEPVSARIDVLDAAEQRISLLPV